ncbi:MAG: carboxypeptidase-like regulatory domain-containing protein, partial [Bacteroidia bacterium]
MKKVYLFLTAFVFLGIYVSAQSNGGALKVTLADKKNKEGLSFGNVVVYNGKVQVAVGTTDIDGNVMIRPITAGKYNVKAVYLGYQPIQINDVQIVDGKTVY